MRTIQRLVFLFLPALLEAQSSTNGVYGGYVGSDRWFADMRRSIPNQNLLQTVAGVNDYRQLPADYIEAAGMIVFPEGNPFPAKRLPDLRITCRDQSVDSVDRAPYVYESGNFFYTVFKKGQTYDLLWMYYFGDREKFASVYVEPAGLSQRSYIFEYRHSSSTVTMSDPARVAALVSGSAVQASGETPRGAAGAVNATQYSIQAPAEAAKLIVSVNTSLSVNLFVRRNTPVAVQNGRAVYDSVFSPYSGQTRFEIPAQSGTYYIAICNFSTSSGGVELTATVEAGTPGPQITQGGIVSAASFQAGPVAPGELVTVFGSGLGPATLVGLKLTGGLVDTTLAETRILFDGTLAPLIYVQANQASAVAPYALAGKATTQMQVEYQGKRSAPIELRVSATAPALFTLDSSGSGQAAVLNQDGSINSALNPASRGSVVVLYGTGEGQTIPLGVDGKLAGDVLPKPALPVAVRIGGLSAEILYAGAAPGLVAGVFQINVRIPNLVAAGSVPVALTAGNASSPPGVTLAVR